MTSRENQKQKQKINGIQTKKKKNPTRNTEDQISVSHNGKHRSDMLLFMFAQDFSFFMADFFTSVSHTSSQYIE